MGINDNTKGMIDAFAKGDYARAKAYAKCILANDNSEKNKYWRNRTTMLLDCGGEEKIELPDSIKPICELFRPGTDFRADMYYLPEAEAPVATEIFRKQNVVRRMQVLGIPATNTTLLYGLPGTGKTELAKFVAYKLNKPLLILRFSNIIDSYMGKTGNNIGKVFDFFAKNDVILFLDELDTVAGRREGSQGCEGEISRTTACIMQEFDRLRGGGIIIAATNRRDLLDEALLRRFSIQHEVKCVGEEERRKIVYAFWDTLDIIPPFDVTAYIENEYTPSRIHTDMIAELSKYLEEHPDETTLETKLKNEIVIPEYWATLFLSVCDVLNMPEKPCAEIEARTYNIEMIAANIPIPEEATVKYNSNTMICYDKRVDVIRYSMYLCRKAYLEYYHTEKDVTLGELAEFVSSYVS